MNQQDPISAQFPVASPSDPRVMFKKQVLDSIKLIIEQATGFRWMETSFLRQSPSHYNGNALDIAPDFDARSKPFYAAYKQPQSDPVLTKRPELISNLRQVPSLIPQLENFRVGIFLETDHIHIGLFKPDGEPHVFYNWEKVKPVYGDTEYRHSLPSIPNTYWF